MIKNWLQFNESIDIDNNTNIKNAIEFAKDAQKTI
jgi:hypothetical protein